MKDRGRFVSVGMPVYNGQRYIAEAIESVLAQTHGDFEFIISDNASTDRTEEICRQYADRDGRIRYVRSDSNRGAAPNYNRVFELSTAPYFKWADYDDVVASTFLARCLDVLEANPEVVLVYPQSRMIDEHGQILGDYRYKADPSGPDARYRFRDLVLQPEAGFQVSGLMRAEAVRRTALHQSFPASDLVFLAEMALQGRFHEIDEPLFFPRYHPEQSTKGAGTVERDRVVFFDTANAGRVLLPKWQYLAAYLRAVGKAPVGPGAKAYCYAQVLRWACVPDHFRALGKDLILAGGQLARRGSSRLRQGDGR